MRLTLYDNLDPQKKIFLLKAYLGNVWYECYFPRNQRRLTLWGNIYWYVFAAPGQVQNLAESISSTDCSAVTYTWTELTQQQLNGPFLYYNITTTSTTSSVSLTFVITNRNKQQEKLVFDHSIIWICFQPYRLTVVSYNSVSLFARKTMWKLLKTKVGIKISTFQLIGQLTHTIGLVLCQKKKKLKTVTFIFLNYCFTDFLFQKKFPNITIDDYTLSTATTHLIAYENYTSAVSL